MYYGDPSATEVPPCCETATKKFTFSTTSVLLLLNMPLSLSRATIFRRQKNPRRVYRPKIAGILFVCNEPEGKYYTVPNNCPQWTDGHGVWFLGVVCSEPNPSSLTDFPWVSRILAISPGSRPGDTMLTECEPHGMLWTGNTFFLDTFIFHQRSVRTFQHSARLICCILFVKGKRRLAWARLFARQPVEFGMIS